MQALSVNSVNKEEIVNPVELVNPVEQLNSVELLNPIKSAANVVSVKPVINSANKPIDNIIEPQLNNLTLKKDNSINRFLEAYGDCV